MRLFSEEKLCPITHIVIFLLIEGWFLPYRFASIQTWSTLFFSWIIVINWPDAILAFGSRKSLIASIVEVGVLLSWTLLQLVVRTYKITHLFLGNLNYFSIPQSSCSFTLFFIWVRFFIGFSDLIQNNVSVTFYQFFNSFGLLK